MPVYQVNILDGAEKVLLRAIPVHLNEAAQKMRGYCILWGDDCRKLEVQGKYRLLLMDGRLVDCIVDEIHESNLERAETVDFTISPPIS